MFFIIVLLISIIIFHFFAKDETVQFIVPIILVVLVIIDLAIIQIENYFGFKYAFINFINKSEFLLPLTIGNVVGLCEATLVRIFLIITFLLLKPDEREKRKQLKKEERKKLIELYDLEKKRKAEQKKIVEAKQQRNLGSYNVEATYIGGHHYFVKPEKGIIAYNSQNDNLAFLNITKDLLFKVKITDVTKISVETEESLTLTRVALIGLFAFALKKKTPYLLVDYNNDINEISSLIFELKNSSEAQTTVNTLNSYRYSALKLRQNSKTILS